MGFSFPPEDASLQFIVVIQVLRALLFEMQIAAGASPQAASINFFSDTHIVPDLKTVKANRHPKIE